MVELHREGSAPVACAAGLFLFHIVDNISQTSSVAENSADAALQEDMAVSDKL